MLLLLSSMSEVIVSKETELERGKNIEEHLSSIHLEPWFSRIRQSEKDNDEDEYQIAFCSYCDSLLERPYWESRYNGINGRCKSCEVIWNLS